MAQSGVYGNQKADSLKISVSSGKNKVYIKFSSEVNFESLRFNSHIITYEDILFHLSENKNIKVAPDKDQIELYDALRNTKYDQRDSIDPGARIIIKRSPGTRYPDMVAKRKLIFSNL